MFWVDCVLQISQRTINLPSGAPWGFAGQMVHRDFIVTEVQRIKVWSSAITESAAGGWSRAWRPDGRSQFQSVSPSHTPGRPAEGNKPAQVSTWMSREQQGGKGRTLGGRAEAGGVSQGEIQQQGVGLSLTSSCLATPHLKVELTSTVRF